MKWNSKENKKFIEAILALETPMEARSFLRDLMTEKELLEFANRLKAAEMLSDKIPYVIIEKKTGLSSATIARVAKWLNTGEGGYKIIFNKIHHHNFSKTREGLS